MFEKLDRQTPLRPSNSFLLGQTMAYAGREIGPEIEYGKTLKKQHFVCNATLEVVDPDGPSQLAM